MGTRVELQNQIHADGVWHRLTIDDIKLTLGECFDTFLDEVLLVKEVAAAVVIASVESSGDPLLGITGLGCALMNISELRDRLHATSQIDWGNFYFMSDMDGDLARRICKDMTVTEAISQSNLSIRVIDDSSLDIFSRNLTLINRVLTYYPAAQVQSSLLSEMDFPN